MVKKNEIMDSKRALILPQKPNKIPLFYGYLHHQFHLSIAYRLVCDSLLKI
jgi:hypothetical protein